jgi:hypothetical protein
LVGMCMLVTLLLYVLVTVTAVVIAQALTDFMPGGKNKPILAGIRLASVYFFHQVREM